MAWQLPLARRGVPSSVRPDGRLAEAPAASADETRADACLAFQASPARSAASEPVVMEAAAVRPACSASSDAPVAGRQDAGRHQARAVRLASPDVLKTVAVSRAWAALPAVAAPSAAVTRPVAWPGSTVAQAALVCQVPRCEAGSSAGPRAAVRVVASAAVRPAPRPEAAPQPRAPSRSPARQRPVRQQAVAVRRAAAREQAALPVAVEVAAAELGPRPGVAAVVPSSPPAALRRRPEVAPA